jgi:hypothetical protein
MAKSKKAQRKRFTAEHAELAEILTGHRPVFAKAMTRQVKHRWTQILRMHIKQFDILKTYL